MEFVLSSNDDDSSSNNSACEGFSSTDHLQRRNRFKDFYTTLEQQLQQETQPFTNEETFQLIQSSMCDTWSEIRKDSSKSLRSLVACLPIPSADRLVSVFLSPLTQSLSLPLSQTQAETANETQARSEPVGGTKTCSDSDSHKLSWQNTHGNFLGLFALIPLIPSLDNSYDCNSTTPIPVTSSSSIFRCDKSPCPSSTSLSFPLSTFSSASMFIAEQVKAVCLEALSHPQLPVREISQLCLQEVSQHCGSLGKSFLGQCLKRIAMLAEGDVCGGTEEHASELDGLLHYVGCMLTAEPTLLLGVLDSVSNKANGHVNNGDDGDGMVDTATSRSVDTEQAVRGSGRGGVTMVVAVLQQVHVCMQHSSSTVRQRAASLTVVCCTIPAGSSGDSGSSSSSSSSNMLVVTAECLRRVVDTIISVLRIQSHTETQTQELTQGEIRGKEDWHVTEGYMLVVETLLVELLAASVVRLRAGGEADSLSSSSFSVEATYSSSAAGGDRVYMDIIRLVPVLIRNIPALTTHSSFEVRRIVSQVLPTLARVMVLCSLNDTIRVSPDMRDLNIPNVTPSEIQVGECLPFVVFVNEVSRVVAYLEEIQRDKEHEKRTMLMLTEHEGSIAARDPAKEISEPYFDWVRQTRRRTGEEDKQNLFFSLFDSLVKHLPENCACMTRSSGNNTTNNIDYDDDTSNCRITDKVTGGEGEWVVQSLLLAASKYVSASASTVAQLQTALFSAGIISLDVIEYGVLTTAISTTPCMEGGGSTEDQDTPDLSLCPWLHSLGLLQLHAYHTSAKKHTATLRMLLTLFSSAGSATPLAAASSWRFISSVGDPAVDPILSTLSISCSSSCSDSNNNNNNRRSQQLEQHLGTKDSNNTLSSDQKDVHVITENHAWIYQEPQKLPKPLIPQSLNVMNKTVLEAISPAIPGLLYTLSVPDLTLFALLSSQWAHCLMTDAYWHLGWGSRASARRSVLETLQANVEVLRVRLQLLYGGRGGMTVSVADNGDVDGADAVNALPREHLVCYVEVFATVLSSLSTSFLTSSIQDSKQVGKFDLKTGALLLNICVEVMQVMQFVKTSLVSRQEGVSICVDPSTSIVADSANSEWLGDVERLCGYVAGRVGVQGRPTFLPSAEECNGGDIAATLSVQSSSKSGKEEEEEEEESEFSDWDDSDSESDNNDGCGGERRSNGSCGEGGGGNVSGSNFDVVLIHNSLQEIQTLLSSAGAGGSALA